MGGRSIGRRNFCLNGPYIGDLVRPEKGPILTKKWPIIECLLTSQNGPKGFKITNIPFVDNLGPLLVHLGPLGLFQAKIKFSLKITSTKEHFWFSGLKINFFLKRTKRVQMDPKWSLP